MNRQIADAWLSAAADLGIKVAAPFQVTDKQGVVHWFEAHIDGFGGPKGTVVGSWTQLRQDDIRKEHGYYYSNLSASYASYERQLFIDTLNDWGWYGEKGKEPAWYTGQPWTKTQ